MLDLNIELLNLFAKALQRMMFLKNLIEKVKSENRSLQADIQQLRDENNRLKGEQAKPDIKANKKNETVPEQQFPLDLKTKNRKVFYRRARNVTQIAC